jgi:subtilisin family serine protease
MPLFILRPKADLVQRAAAVVAMPQVSLRPEDRNRQRDAVAKARANDPIRLELNSWLTKKGKQARDEQIDAVRSTITGSSIVDLSHKEAEQLRHELPDVAVIQDRRLDLIQPNKAGAASAKQKISARDLWHLHRIGLLDKKGRRTTAMTGLHVRVLVLDTGIEGNHPELRGRVGESYEFNTAAWKVEKQPESIDTDQHGTHVAGIVAGRSVGVAPEATLINGVMIPRGQGSLSSFILALEWAASKPDIQIICMSAGIPGLQADMHDVIEDVLSVGVLPVIAIGNEGRNRTRSPGNYAEVLSVGASRRDGMVSSFSSSGTILADQHSYPAPTLVAPGEEVFSCVPGGHYQCWNGTSMAAPIVAGIAALLLQKYPMIPVLQLVEEILDRARYNEDEEEIRQGYGVAHIHKSGQRL